MRYYFHLEHETSVHLDHMGQEFPDTKSMKDHAATAARELSKLEKWKGWSLLVVGTNNTEVLRVPIAATAVSE
jgi:hypothetical protein